MSAITVLALMAIAQATPERSIPPPAPARIIHGYVPFDKGSASPSRMQLGNLYRLAPHVPRDAYVYVKGFTDTAGSAAYNADLSRRRALAVADEAVRLGIDPARIQIVSCGETALTRPTADGVDEPLNRYALFDSGSHLLESSPGRPVEWYSQARGTP